MKSRLIYPVLLFLLLHQICTNVMAQSNRSQKIVFDKNAVNHQPVIQMENTATDQVRLSMKLPAAYTKQIHVDKKKYDRISIEGFSEIVEPGKPALPVLGQFIAVPYGATVHINMINEKYEERDNFYILPAQEPLTDDGKKDESQFTIDQAIYQADQFYPSEISWAEPIKIIRKHPVTILWFTPIQFNPVSKKIRIYTELTIEINFVGRTGTSIDPDYYSKHFDTILKRLIVNPNTMSSSKSILNKQETQQSDIYKSGCDYLVVTHHEFAEAADSLALWRKFCGLETKIVFVEELGNTAENIRNYIQNAYDNWSPVPEYILFLGDAEFVPTNYFTQHSVEDNGFIGTDLYYATVDGSDYFPDLITGRIPVDSGIEALAFIRKIINYERNPVSNPEFYKNAVVAAYFQDDDDSDTPSYNERDGYEDRRFVLTSEEIRDFLISQGYATERIYYAESSVNPTNYNNTGYASGEAIPADLLRARGFLWDGDANGINNRIENGCFLLSHRDHGNRNKWGDPEYSSGNVMSLKNGRYLPVVFSTNCATGWFDNETDEDITETNFNAECFVEYWLRNFEGGAIGVFGSTRVSYSGYNDALAQGFVDAIWQEFLDYQNVTFGTSPIYELGQVLNYGKFYMATRYSNSLTRKIEFEEFHYFGDPATSIWTQYPGDFVVDFADSFSLNQTETSLQVSQEKARVTLLQNDDIIATSLSDASGAVQLSFPPISSEEPITLCVKKENFKPYLATVHVAPAEGFAIICQSKEIIDQDQNNEINIGETITWKLDIRNAGKETAHNIQFEIVSADSFIELLNERAFIDSLGIGEKTTLSELSFKVDKRTQPGHAVETDLVVHASTDYSVVIPLDFVVLQGNPLLTVSPDFIATRLNSQYDSTAVNLTISNNGFGNLEFYLKDEAKELILVGDIGQKWLASIPEGAGNIYVFDRPLFLSRFSCYLKIESPVEIYFSVYEGDQLTGIYNKIGETSQTMNQETEGLITSGFLNLNLYPGKYYYLGVGWTGGDAKVSRAAEVTPYNIPIGEVITGCVNLQGNPPADSVTQKFTRIISFVQELDIGKGNWLTGIPASDSLLPTEETEIELNMIATDPDTTLSTKIIITSNNWKSDTVIVPIKLVVGNPDLNLYCQTGEVIDQDGNENGEINPGEKIILPIIIKNLGIGNATNVLAQLVSTDPNIVLLDSLEQINSIEPDQQVSVPAFRFEVSPYLVGKHQVPFKIILTAENDYARQFEFNLEIVEGEPEIYVTPDSLVGSLSQLNDSLISEFMIANKGYGRLFYDIENPIQQAISIGTPADNLLLPLNNGIGNIYFPIKPAHVLFTQCYFQVDSATAFYFFIYEGDSQKGRYDIIAKSKLNVDEPGMGWYRSGLMECDLSTDKYYYIGVSWIGSAKILRNKENIPFIAWNGKIVSSALNFGGAPPVDAVEIDRGSPLPIAQKIITGEDWWLNIKSVSDTLFPGESDTARVKFYPTAAESTFTANIKILSNDPENRTFQLPTSLSVTAIATNISRGESYIPRSITLEQNYPNPFNPSTTFKYGISKPGHVELSIYNIMGQKVKSLVSRTQQPGFYNVRWYGNDNSGNLVTSGIYFIILKAEGKIVSQKILLLK